MTDPIQERIDNRYYSFGARELAQMLVDSEDKEFELNVRIERLRDLIGDQMRQKNELRSKLLEVAANFVRGEYVDMSCDDGDECCDSSIESHKWIALKLRDFIDDLRATDRMKPRPHPDDPHRIGPPEY